MTNGRILVVGAAVVTDGLILAVRRRRPAGAWEFPGGKCEPGEEPLTALHRELAEELNLRVAVDAEVLPDGGGTWPINDDLHLRVWLARPLSDPVVGPDHDRLCWVPPADLGQLSWLPADVPVAAQVALMLSARAKAGPR